MNTQRHTQKMMKDLNVVFEKRCVSLRGSSFDASVNGKHECGLNICLFQIFNDICSKNKSQIF